MLLLIVDADYWVRSNTGGICAIWVIEAYINKIYNYTVIVKW